MRAIDDKLGRLLAIIAGGCFRCVRGGKGLPGWQRASPGGRGGNRELQVDAPLSGSIAHNDPMRIDGHRLLDRFQAALRPAD